MGVSLVGYFRRAPVLFPAVRAECTLEAWRLMGNRAETTEMHRFSSVLCLVEQGKDNKPVLDRAVALAENDQARLTVATVIPRVSTVRPFAEHIQAAMVREREAMMGSLVEPYRQRLDIAQHILIGTPFFEAGTCGTVPRAGQGHLTVL